MQPPDLQALVEKAGRRYAASIGEVYVEDPFKRHQGGYQHITAEEWTEFDLRLADYRRSAGADFYPAETRSVK
jgi:hypothetical protein